MALTGRHGAVSGNPRRVVEKPTLQGKSISPIQTPISPNTPIRLPLYPHIVVKLHSQLVKILMNTQQEKEELQRRIRGLTTMLRAFAVQEGLSLKRQVIPSFLRHLTTLLTCNDENDPNAKRVIAATGYIDPGRPIRILIAAQDPHVSSFAPPILLRLGQKRSLDEVVAGYYCTASSRLQCADSFVALFIQSL